MPGRSQKLSVLFASFGVSAIGALAGCGHPATIQECEIILEKSAELELKEQNITDPALVEERVAAFKSARGEDLLAKCKGRTVTVSALACVKRAESADALERCLY